MAAKIQIFGKHQIKLFRASQIIVATFYRVQNLKEQGVVMREQKQMPEQHRSSIAVAAFYTTSAVVATLGMAILLTSATIAYAIAQSIK